MSTPEAMSYGLHNFPQIFATIFIGTLIVSSPFIILLVVTLIAVINNILALVCISTLLLAIIGIIWIYVGLRLSLFVYAAVIDGLGPIESLKESWRVSKGNVILLFVTFIIMMIISMAFSVPGFIISNVSGITFLSNIYSIVMSVFLVPLYVIIFGLIYLKIGRKKKSLY
ncbi:MAG: hypothetical protein V5A64_04310 [Candidatus Thermoplasmatota archaeon]